MKGQAIVVGAILLLVVITVIVSGLFIFTGNLTDFIESTGVNQTESSAREARAAVVIDRVYKSEDKIEVKNIGEVELSTDKTNIYLNGTILSPDVGNCPDELSPGESCNITVVPDIENNFVKVVGEYGVWDELWVEP